MKRFVLIPFLITSLLLSVNVFAHVQNYYEDITLDDTGKSLVKLAITISQPITNLKFLIFGEVNDFHASSNKGSINCSVRLEGISYVDCTFQSPEEMVGLSMIDINFTTFDFVKVLNKKFYFTADLNLNQNIDSASIFVRLPEGMIVGENETKLIFPENSTMVSDGRRIIMVWYLANVKANESLRFQILYERTPLSPLFQFRLRDFVVFGIAAAAASGFIYIRYFRKPQKLILSVLDDYERKVMNLIIASEGVIDQKKVVKETNLSKAKVSRVVKSLVERGLIEIERLGRRNKLKLIKKKFKI